MSNEQPTPGKIVWQDLTVPNAAEVRNFYAKVVGWKASPQSMGDYDDYNMQLPGNGETVAGICHQQGPNAQMPAQWMLYVEVADVAASAQQAVAAGGSIVDGPRAMGKHQFCVIKDPAGAVLGIIGQ